MDSNINYKEWYKLDNAAKIYPATTSEESSNLFRISAWLYEDVDKETLFLALQKTLPRYPTFAAKLRRGVFWYFLDRNNSVPIVREESPRLYKRLRAADENGYLFRVTYYGKRISLEMFHSLSDGYGGLEFLKSILFHYFEIKGIDVKAQGKVKTASSPYNLKEVEDSFFVNYEKTSLKGMKSDKAYHLSGLGFIQGGNGVIAAECSAAEFNTLAKSYNCTVGEFVNAVHIKSMLDAQPAFKKSKKPLVLLIPVNLRRFFNSQTLRNFSSFIYIKVKPSEAELPLEEIITLVKEQTKQQLTKEHLSDKMSGPVSVERKWYFRIVPLFIKVPCLKIAYNLLGDKLNTSTVSNMGRVDMPESMIPLIEKFDFSLPATALGRVNLGLGSYNDRLVFLFTRTIMETDIVRNFITSLSDKVNFTVSTNSWEEENFERPKKKFTKAERNSFLKHKKKLKKSLKKTRKLEKKNKKREKKNQKGKE